MLCYGAVMNVNPEQLRLWKLASWLGAVAETNCLVPKRAAFDFGPILYGFFVPIWKASCKRGQWLCMGCTKPAP